MISIAICDDDLSYNELLGLKLKSCVENNLETDYELFSFSDIEKLYEHIKNNRVDLVFLDIMVNDINSIDWLVEHQAEFKGLPFVLMTAYPYETENLSEIECCYYLLKPKMTDEQILRAFKRALNVVTKSSPTLSTVSFGKKSYTIDFQNILYLESMNNNLEIHFVDKSSINIYSTLKEFRKKLTPNFIHCHKSYVVNMNYIQGFEPNCFILPDGIKIPIPPKKYKSMISIYRDYILFS